MYDTSDKMTRTERNDLFETCRIGKFADIRLHDFKTSTLSPEKCSELVTLVKRGEAARQRLIEGNLYRVSNFINKYGKGTSIPDLMHEGIIALISSIDTIISDDNVSVDSFNGIVNKSIADAVNTFIDINHNPNEIMLGDDDYGAPSEELENVLSKSCLKSTMMDVVAGLDQREQTVIILRYGLDGRPPRVLNSVAIEVGVSPERVRQIEMETLRKFRHPHRARKLRDFLYD